jgi:glutathione S-transferase
MITLHHLNNSRSQRILWLLEELGLPYEIIRYERDKKTMLAPETLKKIHPLGKSPVITDGELTVAESGAIIEYLVDTYGQGKLKPAPGTSDLLKYHYWLHYAEGSLMPPLLLTLIFNRIETAREMPFFVKPIALKIVEGVRAGFIRPQLKTHLDYLEGELSKTEWFAGEEFSAADIQMSFPLEAAAARKLFDSSKPKLTAYIKKIHARPAYQRALKSGGEFTILS